MSSVHEKSNAIAPFSETKWLILSSSVCFGVPLVLALYLKEYAYALHFGNIVILSANYWRNARYNWHRTMDVTYARYNVCMFFYNAFMYCRHPSIVFLAHAIYWSYNKGIALYYKKNQTWVRYHMLFHFLTSCGQTLFLYNMHNTNIKQHI